jgi:hypothetical protein
MRLLGPSRKLQFVPDGDNGDFQEATDLCNSLNVIGCSGEIRIRELWVMRR